MTECGRPGSKSLVLASGYLRGCTVSQVAARKAAQSDGVQPSQTACAKTYHCSVQLKGSALCLTCSRRDYSVRAGDAEAEGRVQLLSALLESAFLEV